MSDAISNILSTCIYRTPGRVGFARGGKLLLKITNLDNGMLQFESTRLYADQSSDDHRLGKASQFCCAEFGTLIKVF
jgi:hypothetical protein